MTDPRGRYFAYGSNLSSARLLERLPRASIDRVAILHRHRLCWRKNDRGQSGKCDIELTEDAAHQVYGVIYRMTEAERAELDVIEGHGFGYDRKNVMVTTLEGLRLEVFTYFALDIDHRQQPFHWYKEHVLRGAIEHRFPEDYIRMIRETESIDDHDHARVERELAIHAAR